jgi:hypothetical protein
MRELQRSGTTIVFVSHSMHAIHLLCPRSVVVHRGRLAFDGPSEAAIACYHQLLSHGDGDQAGASVRVVDRALLADGRPAEAVGQDDELTYCTTLRFEDAVESPQVYFRVIAEDGTLAYSMQTAFDAWRSFAAGEEASVRVAFRPRFGGGGTFRIAVVVTDQDGATVHFHDEGGPSFYVPPRLGVSGVADLGATITVDGEARTDHRALRLDSSFPVEAARE